MKIRKRLLYILFLVLLWLPLLQMWFPLFHEHELKGAFVAHTKPELTANSWFDGTFQEHYAAYLNDSLGFHNSLVILRNAFHYYLFHQSTQSDLIVGKHDCLFEKNYLLARNGEDFLGTEKIQKMVKSLKLRQDQWTAEGKTFVVCLAPSKADFCSELIPKRYDYPAKDSTNYLQFKRILTEEGVNVIDFNDWFLRMKPTAKYPLYPKYGIHWSEYGMLMAVDSLIHYLELKRKVSLRHLVYDGYELSDVPRSSDYDIAESMNLPSGCLHPQKLCYPNWRWEDDTTKVRPKAIVVADSYYWQIFNLAFQPKCLEGAFWYYNHSIYPDSYDTPITTEDIDCQAAIDSSDVILIMITGCNLKDFGWGF